jgi:hypothetical protein
MQQNAANKVPKKMKRRRGRPKLKASKRRSVALDVSLLPQEARRMTYLAADAGKSFSSWAREVLLSAAGECEAR